MSVIFTAQEDAIIDRVGIDQALAALDPVDRDIVRYAARYGTPPDSTSRWPMTYTDIGRVVGLVHRSRPLSATYVQERIAAVKLCWSVTNAMLASSDFTSIYRRYAHTIATLATAIARGDRDATDDLAQEGRVALWRMDHSRLDDKHYIVVVLRSAMIDWLRRERRQSRDATQESRAKTVESVEKCHRSVRGGRASLRLVRRHVGAL